MGGRFFLSLIAAAAFLAPTAENGLAQSRDPSPSVRENPQTAKPARRFQRPLKSDPTARLNALYDALAKAPNAEIAKLIETRIEAARLESGSPTADLLMARARFSMEAKDNRLAFELLDAVIQVAPDYVEARAQRATLYYQTKDIARSLADLRVIVAKDPRHYGALAGLGVIFQDIGQDKLALEAFRRALKLDPYMESVPEIVKKLSIKVEGREI